MRRLMRGTAVLIVLVSILSAGSMAAGAQRRHLHRRLKANSANVRRRVEMAGLMEDESATCTSTPPRLCDRLPALAAEAIRRNPLVAYVEAKGVCNLGAVHADRHSASVCTGEPLLDIDSTDDVRVDVDVAVIDTGIDLDILT